MRNVRITLMSDTRFRRLQRSTDPDDQIAFLAEALRSGVVSPEQVQLLSNLRHPSAMAILPPSNDLANIAADGMHELTPANRAKFILQLVRNIPIPQTAGGFDTLQQLLTRDTPPVKAYLDSLRDWRPEYLTPVLRGYIRVTDSALSEVAHGQRWIFQQGVPSGWNAEAEIAYRFLQMMVDALITLRYIDGVVMGGLIFNATLLPAIRPAGEAFIDMFDEQIMTDEGNRYFLIIAEMLLQQWLGVEQRHNPFAEGQSPLDYHGTKPKRLSWLDPDAPGPLPSDVYYAETKRELRKKNRQPYSPKRYETIPGADPGTVAFLDYEVLGDGSIYIHFIHTRNDQRGKGHMRRLIDKFIEDHWTAPEINFGEIHNQHVWKYFLEKKNAKDWKGPYLRGKIRRNPLRRNINFPDKPQSGAFEVGLPHQSRKRYDSLMQMVVGMRELLNEGHDTVWLKAGKGLYEVKWMEIETVSQPHAGVTYEVVCPNGGNLRAVLHKMEDADSIAIMFFIRYGAPIYLTVFDTEEVHKYIFVGGVIEKK